MSGFENFKITRNSKFSKNHANIAGGDIYAEYSDYNLTIENTQITNYLSLNSIYLNSIGFSANSL